LVRCIRRFNSNHNPFFFLFLKHFSIDNSGAIAAYGSVSAVTFVTAITFLEMQNYTFSGHMVAVMALEAPAIIVGVILIRLFSKNEVHSTKISLIKHSLLMAVYY
jgi:hypothetical protein